MLLVGAALYVFYKEHPPAGEVAEYLKFDGQMVPRGIDGGDAVFPAWIVAELPPGLSGLILAGVFAAAISSLDSILAALSQTTLSLFAPPEEIESEEHGRKLIVWSRILVVFWGIILAGFTLGMYEIKKQGVLVLPLAFGMTVYTTGPLLAFMVGAVTGKTRFFGLLVGAVVSFVLAAFVRTDIWVLMKDSFPQFYASLANLPTYELVDGVLKPRFGYVWLWPVTAVITFLCGVTIGPRGGGRAAAVA
jgi:Na+/proline symporter